MEVTKLNLDSTGRFSPLMSDYLSQDKKLQPFYNRFPSSENFSSQILEKSNQKIDRNTLVKSLLLQNEGLNLSKSTSTNIKSLKNDNTFTVTTGHQLCLFTGPLYFIYKIISCINLAQKLNSQFEDKHFVPVFWMASEDHDFEEVNHVNLFGKKLSWENDENGAVGRMSLKSFDKVLQELDSIMGESENAAYLSNLFKEAYSKGNLAQASRYLVNELFGKYGLVIIDGDDSFLKNKLESIIRNDVEKSKYFEQLSKTSNALGLHYKKQAHVREVNFFKLSENSRERIAENQQVDLPIELYSPNVLMRPLFQELVLPNIAYVGGGAEIAYWMQLKDIFETENIVFPMLVLRNSALVLDSNKTKKLNKLNLKLKDLFISEHELHKAYVLKNSTFSDDFSTQNDTIEKLYSDLAAKFDDLAIKSSIDAEKNKNLKSFDSLVKRLLKHEKNKHSISLNQISNLKESLFPQNSLQERFDNFIPYYLKYGEDFIKILKQEFDPLDTNFVILAH
ncbi:bacillithiol biosynthesis cysteine-adding enzyme BshC [Flavobacteriales bacterium]|nr:bacillithiol biosynthesis cysteine-adding enzyme BshC [Flavobacteriales bacterium]